ncbi:unnamed protein product [Schistosoma turkestanicum]|nr:unnamed protein product [Schistosoma turkestanicum]
MVYIFLITDTTETSSDIKYPVDSSLSPDLSEISSYGLQFTYVDEHNNPVQFQQNAHHRQYNIDGVENLSGYRIRCSYEDLITSGVSYRIDWSSSGLTGNDITYTYAYLLDPNAPKLCTNPIASINSIDTTSHSVHTTSTGSTTTTTSSSTTFTFKPISKVDSATNLETGMKRCKSQESVSSNCLTNKSSRNCTNSIIPESTIQPKSPTKSHSILTRQLSLSSTSEMLLLNRDLINYNSQTSSEPLNPHTSITKNCSNPISVDLQTTHQISSASLSTPLIIPGNSYEIILLADVRENFGSNKVRQMLPMVFQKFNIKCESRALPVGDFLWIARWRNESSKFCYFYSILL